MWHGFGSREERTRDMQRLECSHRFLKLLKVLLLISELLLQLQELLLLALLDDIVLVGFLAPLEGVSVQVIVC
jgi:hypothetical protein